jgi:O-antigen ligase
MFTGYLGITLIYSDNPAYGAQKILNFLASTVPSVIAFYYSIVTVSKERFKIFIIALVTITLVTVTYILIDYPFEQSTIYEYRAGRWSHVIYGRLISSIALVLLLYSFTLKAKSKIFLFSILAAIAIYGTYISAFRAGFVGLMLVGGGLLVTSFQTVFTKNEELSTKEQILTSQHIGNESGVLSPMERKKTMQMRGKQLVGIVTVVILTISFIFLIPKPEIIETRFVNLTLIEDLKFGGDEPINTRIEALKISKELFLTHPIFGVGFGGFRSYNDFTEVVKYPHNIFVEMAVEGGILGLLVLCALLFVIFKSSYRFSFYTFIFLLFTLFLAMFSKDISNQSLLWIGLAFIGLRKRKDQREKYKD